jgi:hypothetical protein
LGNNTHLILSGGRWEETCGFTKPEPGTQVTPQCGGLPYFPWFCITWFRAHLIPTGLTVHHMDREKETS